MRLGWQEFEDTWIYGSHEQGFANIEVTGEWVHPRAWRHFEFGCVSVVTSPFPIRPHGFHEAMEWAELTLARLAWLAPRPAPEEQAGTASIPAPPRSEQDTGLPVVATGGEG